MDIVKSLRALRQLEVKMQDLYEFYHKHFSTDKEVAGCFFELSLEEKSHAELIDYQLRTVKKNSSLFNDVDFDIESLNQFMSRTDTHISSKEPPSLEGALKIGIELENNALEYHYRTLIKKSNAALGELIDKLGTADEEHRNKLRQLAERRGFLDMFSSQQMDNDAIS